MKIQQSAEDYLESILVLGMNRPYVRSIDVANDLGFSKPSVSVAMKNLRENGYISMSQEGHITLLRPSMRDTRPFPDFLSCWAFRRRSQPMMHVVLSM